MKHKTVVETVDTKEASHRYAVLHQVFPITEAIFEMNHWLYLWPFLHTKNAPQQTAQLLLLEQPV